jgi:putative ABC transport system ATP-binding protein
MEKPSKGNILIANRRVSAMNEKELALFRQSHLGFIFQSYNLLPQMSALENTALPLCFGGVDKKTRNKAAAAILKKVGLENRMHHYPGQMSGGQQQRVGIARALVNRPAVIFADEPTGNLDSKTKVEILNLIRSFATRYNQTIIMVTHDPQTAEYADHTVHLLDGKIVKEEFFDRKDKTEAKASV